MRYQNLILAAAVLALACATWLERPKTVTAQTTYSQPVKVVNAGASQAVPVQPQGTTPVNGTVTVGNDSAHPVPTAAAGSEVILSGKCTIPANSQVPVCFPGGSIAATGIVFESITCSALGQANDTVYAAVYGLKSDFYFPLQHVGVLTYNLAGPTPSSDIYSGTQNFRLYTQGDTATIMVSRQSAAATQVSCSLNGWRYQ